MEEVLKNLNDNCNYRVIKLENQINCLLISDQSKIMNIHIYVIFFEDIDVSSFCLNISIGALEDPLEVLYSLNI